MEERSPSAPGSSPSKDAMEGGAIYTREELTRIRKALRDGGPPLCPRCDVKLVVHPVPLPPGVSYVRRRSWWMCPTCRRSAVVNREP